VALREHFWKKNCPTNWNSQSRDVSRVVLTHAARHLPWWLTSDVRRFTDGSSEARPQCSVNYRSAAAAQGGTIGALTCGCFFYSILTTAVIDCRPP